VKKNLKQTAILLIGQGVVIGAGFGIKAIQTRYLGAETYGLYAFFSSFIALALLFFRFGYFNSIQILLTETKEASQQQKLAGLGYLISLVLGLLFAVFIFVSAFWVDDLWKLDIGKYMMVAAPFTILLPFRNFISAYSIGTNKLNLLASFDSMAKILFLVLLTTLVTLEWLNLYWVIIGSIVTFSLPIAVASRNIKPHFRNIKTTWTAVQNKNKQHGFHFYLGTTANQSTYKSDELLITYFINATQNGFYTIAEMLCTPMVLVSQAFSNTYFKKFRNQSRIPSGMLLINFLWLCISGSLLWLLVDFLVPIMFGEEFTEVADLTKGLILAFFFQGLYQPYMFLTAKSKGKAIRNVDFIEAGTNLLGNIILIPIIGIWGAIYTSILAKLIHYLGKVYLYRQYKLEKL